MNSIPMDKAGRIVLPRDVRRQLHLRAGDRLEAKLGADGVTLTPLRTAPARLVRENGRVFREVPGVEAELAEFDAVLRRGGEERDSRAAGL